MIGIVARVFKDKGFGFIEGVDGIQYFFHRDEFNGFFDDLATDIAAKTKKIKVRFEVVTAVKGPRAVQVYREDGGVSATD